MQKVFLDFDGERVNTACSAARRPDAVAVPFIPRAVGADERQRDPLIDRIVATVKENIRTDLMAQGLNARSRSRC